MQHLTIRVAWHDNQWNGTICSAPSHNGYCLALKNIRKERNDALEGRLAGRSWQSLHRRELPPCIAESGGFMNEREWVRTFEHPFQNLLPATHGSLRRTNIRVEPYTALAVPFRWLLRDTQPWIDASLPDPLPPDLAAPFRTPWVFSHARQDAICKQFFRRLTPEHSLVFFYCSAEGHPLGDSLSRLVVGVGRIQTIGPQGYYESNSEVAYPFWDRKIHHTIRPDGGDGFLLPYHDYLTLTGDADEDARRRDLLEEIAVTVDPAHSTMFSYTSELASSDVALSTLMRCLDVVRLVRAHGVAGGDWASREQWLNDQIAATWRDRGEFPGMGSALEALGLRMGTSLILDLTRAGRVGPEDNPWQVADALLRGTVPAPHPAYASQLAHVGRVWSHLPEERRNLLYLLSRFDLTPEQASRWYDPERRAMETLAACSDSEILANPYRIVEVDLGTDTSPAITLAAVDHGIFPDDAVRVRHPFPAPTSIADPQDIRRIRGALGAILRAATDAGDTLLSAEEARERLEGLPIAQPPRMVGVDWLTAYRDQLADTVTVYDVAASDRDAASVNVIQLAELRRRENYLRKVLQARAAAPLDALRVDWRALLITTIGDSYQPQNQRHRAALDEQVAVLEQITTRKLSVLTGHAGTGKTSVMGALLGCPELREDGVLLLAPTGKARVRLEQTARKASESLPVRAYTIAQFLLALERYDTDRQRELFTGEIFRLVRTVVIDEASMLTLDALTAVLLALDLTHVQRIILVGDPNQLPPIGAGRPFADLVAYLDSLADEDPDHMAANALGRLHMEVRTRRGDEPSDALRLAAWFTREPQPVNADRILDQIHTGARLNDLDVGFWKTPEELRTRILENLRDYLGVQHRADIAGFDRALGLGDGGRVQFEEPDGVARFQILSPTRMQPHGVYDLNRWLQRLFRGAELRRGRGAGGKTLGQEEIVHKDKVIQVRNERRWMYDWQKQSRMKGYIANGEIGVITSGRSDFMNVAFSGHAGQSVGYIAQPYIDSACPLELAYALTVHKAQGSQFDIVFVIIPEKSSLLSRELLYTALTRSRERLVLLVQGDDAGWLYGYSLPSKSDTARRNTNMFNPAVRGSSAGQWFARSLIHRTHNGRLVRSKSELVIANMLEHMDITYKYEEVFYGAIEPGRRLPDFTFETPDGRKLLWEHLGKLNDLHYLREWDEKRRWYQTNGILEGVNLFTTRDDERGGLDSREIHRVALEIQRLL